MWQGLKRRYRICLVNLAEAQGVRLAEGRALYLYKFLAVAPTVEKTEPYGLEVVVGIEVPFAVCCDAGIFSLHGREV